MLFRKKIERSCSYCQYGASLDNEKILCSKKGCKNATDRCRRFKYDPCKRIPVKARTLDFSVYDKEDYSL